MLLAWGGFHTAICALRFKFALCAHLFEQIYSNLASCICALCSTFCIFSQILGALYAFPNFFEIHPWLDFLSTLFYDSIVRPGFTYTRTSPPTSFRDSVFVLGVDLSGFE
jgi:hypothetical protein